MEGLKRKLLLILLLIIFVLGFSNSFLIANALSTQEVIRDGRKYANTQMNAYLDLALDINRSFLKTIESEWEVHLEGDVDIDLFIRQGILPLKSSAYRSLIVVIYGEDFELIYNFPDYSDFNPNNKDLEVNHLIVFDLDGGVCDYNDCTVFGQGNRFFVEGIRLYNGNEYFDVYVGFNEKVMHDNFISLIEVETIDRLDKKMGNIIFISYFIAFSILLIIIYIVFYAQCIQVLLRRPLKDDLECYKRAIESLESKYRNT